MRKVLAITLLLAFGTITAQEDLIKVDYPYIGTSGLYRSSTPQPLKTLDNLDGIDQVWDYSTLANSQQLQPVNYLPIIEATDIDKSMFPNATFFRPKSSISSVRNFYTEDIDSYNLLGFSLNSQYYKLSSQIKYYPFPLKYGETITSKFSYEVEANGEGLSSVTYDGTGKLILPDNEFENVFRLKFITKTVFEDDKTDTTLTTEYQFIERGTGLLLFSLREIQPAENPEQRMYVYEYYVKAISSVNEELSENSKLYPNPATNFISLEIPNAVVMNYEIIDINGRVVESSNNGNNIDISKLISGTYFIKAQLLTDEIVLKKFVKQ